MLLRKVLFSVGLASFLLTATGCGTLTGLPAHGGGKRSLIEQELVSAAVRGAIKQIDFSPLRGKTVFIELGMISDAGGGNMGGGKFSLGTLLTLGGMASPVTTTNHQYQGYTATSSVVNISTIESVSDANGTENGTGDSTTASTTNGNSTLSSTTHSSGSNTGTSSSTTNGANTNTTNIGASTNSTTSSGNGSSTNTTQIGGSTNASSNNSQTNPYTTSNTGNVTSNGTNGTTTTTGATTTTQTGSSSGNTTTGDTTNIGQVNSSGSSTTNIGASTNTSNGTSSNAGTATTNIGASTNTSAGTNTSTTDANSSGTSTGTASTNQNGTTSSTQNGTQNSVTASENSLNTNGTSNTNGTKNTTTHTLNESPVKTVTQKKGNTKTRKLTLAHKGLGNYQNMAVPVSDGNYLAKLLTYNLRLNQINVTLNPANADAVLTVMVDVFGILRTRTDWAIHNKEKVRAKTTIEVAAFNRQGKLIMPPRQGSYESVYEESYIAWVGPYVKRKYHHKGKSLMVDYSIK